MVSEDGYEHFPVPARRMRWRATDGLGPKLGNVRSTAIPGWELFDENSGLADEFVPPKITKMRRDGGDAARSIRRSMAFRRRVCIWCCRIREPFSRDATCRRGRRSSLRPESGRAVNYVAGRCGPQSKVASAVAEFWNISARDSSCPHSGEKSILSCWKGRWKQSGRWVQSGQAGIERSVCQTGVAEYPTRSGRGAVNGARVHVNVREAHGARGEVVVEGRLYDPEAGPLCDHRDKIRGTRPYISEAWEMWLRKTTYLCGIGRRRRGRGSSTRRPKADEIVQYEIGNTPAKLYAKRVICSFALIRGPGSLG